MSNFAINPRFTPLHSSSQGDTCPVLYYDNQAPLDALYETLFSRLVAVSNLLDNLHEYKRTTPQALHAVTAITTLLLSDVLSLLEEFNPMALQLRAEQAKTSV